MERWTVRRNYRITLSESYKTNTVDGGCKRSSPSKPPKRSMLDHDTETGEERPLEVHSLFTLCQSVWTAHPQDCLSTFRCVHPTYLVLALLILAKHVFPCCH